MILVCGVSYTGRALARLMPVHFLSRNPANFDHPGLLPYDPGANYELVVDCVPEPVQGAPAYANEMKRAQERGARIVHLSSTVVYPEPGGSGVPYYDETSPVDETRPRAQNRLRLESIVRAVLPEAVIVRCGGIYGPGRALPLHFQAGDFSRIESGNRMVSRIHVDDLAGLLVSLRSAPDVPSVLNAVDEYPSANAEVFAWLEERLALKIPGAWRNEPVSGRGIRSVHLRRFYDLKYPTYREGFESVLSGGTKPSRAS